MTFDWKLCGPKLDRTQNGAILKFTKCEAFMEMKRIPGGGRAGFLELPIGELKDESSWISFNIHSISISKSCFNSKPMVSAFLLGKLNILEGRLSEWGHLEPLKRNIKRWRRSRDGCAGQYQGKGAFVGWKAMKARHRLECKDKQKPSNRGKDIHSRRRCPGDERNGKKII